MHFISVMDTARSTFPQRAEGRSRVPLALPLKNVVRSRSQKMKTSYGMLTLASAGRCVADQQSLKKKEKTRTNTCDFEAFSNMKLI